MKKMSKVLTLVFALAMILTLCSVGFVANAATPIPEEGYAAVGFVDETAGKAEVLLGTGEQGAVAYTGTAPTAGGLYKYTRDAENVYTFEAMVASNGSDPLAAAGWGMWATTDNTNWWSWDANGLVTYYADNTPIFIRKSATSWALTDRSIFPANPGAIATAEGILYLFDLTATDMGANYKNVGAALLAGHDGTAIAEPNLTGISGLPTAYKDLAALTTDLHGSGNAAGGNSPVTGDNGISVVAVVVASSAVLTLGALCLIERKKVLSK